MSSDARTLISKHAAAERLGVTLWKLSWMCKFREIPCVLGPRGLVRFDPADLDAWIAERKQQAEKPPLSARQSGCISRVPGRAVSTETGPRPLTEFTK